MRLMSVFPHLNAVAALLMVIPRSCSSSSQSMRAVPLVHLPHSVLLAGVIEEAFADGGLPGVDVSDDSDVA